MPLPQPSTSTEQYVEEADDAQIAVENWDVAPLLANVALPRRRGATLGCAAARDNSLLVGGREVELRLIDAVSGDSSWCAKNITNNAVNLQAKVWNRACVFLPESESVVAAATHYGEVCKSPAPHSMLGSGLSSMRPS